MCTVEAFSEVPHRLLHRHHATVITASHRRSSRGGVSETLHCWLNSVVTKKVSKVIVLLDLCVWLSGHARKPFL